MVDYRDPQRQNKILSQLNTYGFCIVNNVLTNEESNKMAIDMASTLSYASQRMPKPFNINDQSTFNTLRDMLPTRGFIFQNFGFGQSQVCWDIRTNLNVITCFNDIYNTQLINGIPDLLVSMDGFSFSVPPELNNGRGFHKEPSFHFDQATNSTFDPLRAPLNVIYKT